MFQLGDIPGGAKEDLLPAIQRHFAQQVIIALPAPYWPLRLLWLSQVCEVAGAVACACHPPRRARRLLHQVHGGAVQVVDEAEILIAFASRVRRQSLRQTSPLPAAKKPRGVAKPLR